MSDIFDVKVYYETDYRKWDKLVNDNFPEIRGCYNLTAAEELSNDSAWTFELDKKELETEYIKEYHEQELKEAFERCGKYRTRVLALELLKRGVLQEGNYIIEISW